jgi:hypothetical protein
MYWWSSRDVIDFHKEHQVDVTMVTRKVRFESSLLSPDCTINRTISFDQFLDQIVLSISEQL